MPPALSIHQVDAPGSMVHDPDVEPRLLTQLGVVCGCILLVAGPLLAVRLAPPPTGPVAVFTNPFSSESAADIVARSGGQLVRGGPWRWMVIGDSPDPGFRERLRPEGAWLVTTPINPAACAFSRS
ncbi:hypothetical protein SLNSH_12585 [Alsobacter soli]|uniref:Uncharacterized protein n=1 Tax=Alsobacter soli TaxID=2109933 RepID=A0A2T1HSV9_9HYPH|nr:hypothetical protein [Alsobacter soli]PSC04609.1 hypothetical protein SLNSH_12585 [Alsobacter soli]